MKTGNLFLALMVLLLTGATVFAQDSAEKPSAPPPPCGQPEAAQFDFWLGEWEVLAKDRVVGHNVISRIQGGCTLLEEYLVAGGKTWQVLFDGLYRHPASKAEGGVE